MNSQRRRYREVAQAEAMLGNLLESEGKSGIAETHLQGTDKKKSFYFRKNRTVRKDARRCCQARRDA